MHPRQYKREEREEKIKGDIASGALKEDWSPLKYKKVTCPLCKGKERHIYTDKNGFEWSIQCLYCMGKGTVEEINEG